MQVVLAAVLIALAAALRLVPHAPNFAPIAAIALFSGTVLPRRHALVVPLFAMLVSDAVIGFYEPRVMAAVYIALGFTVVLGFWVRTQTGRATHVLGASLAGSVLFFALTNFAVWLWSGMYARTTDGLLAAYVMGIPFFRNTLVGDLCYNGLIFGLYAVAGWTVTNRAWLRDRQMMRNPHA
jgi:hypothetical protein